LKTYPYSKCPPILVPLIETEDVLAWTEEELNKSVRVKQGEGGGREGGREGWREDRHVEIKSVHALHSL